jgi:hypothetical protein
MFIKSKPIMVALAVFFAMGLALSGPADAKNKNKNKNYNSQNYKKNNKNRNKNYNRGYNALEGAIVGGGVGYIVGGNDGAKPWMRLRCANDISTFLRSLREIAYC